MSTNFETLQSVRALAFLGVGRTRRGLTMMLFCASLFATAHAAGGTWIDAGGQPTPAARTALQLLAQAADDGLVPGDYRGPFMAPVQGPQFADALDSALQRYLRDLHLGRVDPRALGFRVARTAPTVPDFAALAHTAAAQERLPQLVASLRPQLPQYERLRQALAGYRALDAATPALTLSATGSVKPGQVWDGVSSLHAHLRALGDLPADAPAAGDVYDDALVDAVRRFQHRHGLTVDGVIGAATRAALAVPLAQRVQQLEFALERLRWLPDFGSQRFIGINIPMYRLWAWDPTVPGGDVLDMRVVVGRALNTQTPVMHETMRYLMFRPYWNIPRSITLRETLPALARDPGYLQRNDMEIVRGMSDDGAVPVPTTAQNIALVRQGSLRIRQRPGPKNSLGAVKFIFPNNDNIYLHDTPATSLFGRARRDFSHGCVRVAQPVDLAHWVLKAQPGWSRERIESAMAGNQQQQANLAQPLPVILFYMTAMVMPSDGLLYFADDIYGHDARLARALAR